MCVHAEKDPGFNFRRNSTLNRVIFLTLVKSFKLVTNGTEGELGKTLIDNHSLLLKKSNAAFTLNP